MMTDLAGAPLIDRFQRVHDSLRISVTDRCNVRCFYCMPEEAVSYTNREEILIFEEIERVARVAVSLGVNKIRITGGEPLVRRDLPQLVEKLAAIPGILDIALTTNAVLLKQYAQALYDSGLRRLNIHVDTLDRERFKQITRRDDLPRVLEGIDAAERAGFKKIKINVVAIKNLIEPDIVPMAKFCRERGFEPRFIEFMPLDSQSLWDRKKVLFADDIAAMIEREIGPLAPVPDRDPRAPATDFAYADGKGRVGFIASISKPFCLNCNRIRLTSDGKLRYCLFAIEETDVKNVLRSGAPAEQVDQQLAEAFRRNISEKWLGHEINSSKFIPPPRPMYAIGG